MSERGKPIGMAREPACTQHGAVSNETATTGYPAQVVYWLSRQVSWLAVSIRLAFPEDLQWHREPDHGRLQLRGQLRIGPQGRTEFPLSRCAIDRQRHRASEVWGEFSCGSRNGVQIQFRPRTKLLKACGIDQTRHSQRISSGIVKPDHGRLQLRGQPFGLMAARPSEFTARSDRHSVKDYARA